MKFSHMTLPKWLHYLPLAGIALISLTATTYAESSSTPHRSFHGQLSPHHELHGQGIRGNGASGHVVNYEGHGFSHGSPHHGLGHAGHPSNPPGDGHHGGYGSGTGAHASGHPGPHQSASGFIEHVLRFKDGMGITDEQEAALRTLETNFKKTQIKLKAEGDLANLELHELLRNNNASMSEIETKLKRVHELKANLYLASIKTRRDAKAVLSDEQRSRMETIHERIKNHGSKMKGYSRGHSPHEAPSKQDG